jgi:hypothetical protein
MSLQILKDLALAGLVVFAVEERGKGWISAVGRKGWA